MVNFTPYDTFGRSSRRQVGFITVERASRAARAADSRRLNAHGTDGDRLAFNTHTSITIRSWAPDTTNDALSRYHALDMAGIHVGVVFLDSDRYFAMVSYPEPGNTAWVVLPGSYPKTPMGMVLARRAVEGALVVRAAFLRSSALTA